MVKFEIGGREGKMKMNKNRSLSFLLILLLITPFIIIPIPNVKASTNFTEQVGMSSDDALKRVNPAFWDTASNVIGAGDSGAANFDFSSGMRFQTVVIPVGSAILAAHLEVRAWVACANELTSFIHGEDVDDAATFTTVVNYTGRTRTAASVTWTIPNTWVQDTWYNSPDISDIIQEIVNRGGWASGNDIVIFWSDSAGFDAIDYAQGYSWDKNAASAAKLYVEWEPAVAPTNDAVSGTPRFDTQYDWINVTVSDLNLVAELRNVTIQVNTTGDAEQFEFLWVQATDTFSEISDSHGIATLDTARSIRINLDADTDIICFRFMITGGTPGDLDVRVTTFDDAELSDVDIFENVTIYKLRGFLSTIQDLVVAWMTNVTASVLWVGDIVLSMYAFFAATLTWTVLWIARFLDFWVTLFGYVWAILNGTYSSWGNIWIMIDLANWWAFVPIAGSIAWYLSLDSRAEARGDWMGIFVGDIQMMWWLISSIYNFVMGILDKIASVLLWWY